MTRMSDHGRGAIVELGVIRRRSALARALHDPRTVLRLLLIAVGGCVIPPSLSVDNQDAGVNSPPAIMSVRSDQQALPENSKVVFARGTGTIQFTLLDTDVADDLEVRIFVDYTASNTTAPRAICKAPANGTPTRTTTCDVQALCLPADDGKVDLPMSTVVFDRQVLDTGTPAFQAMAPGGLSTSKFYFLACQAPST